MAKFDTQPLDLLPKGQFTPLNDITIPGLINAAVTISLIVSCILFVFSFLLGGIKFIISGGDKERTDNAKRQVVNALVGIFIIFCSWAIINLISQFFGIDLTHFEIPVLQ